MKLRESAAFVLQAATVGLAVAFLVVLWRPELVGGRRVELIESPVGRTVAAEGPVSYAAAVEAAAPAVVNIFTQKTVTRRGEFLDDPLFRHFFGDQFGRPRKQLETSLGSGVVVDRQGYILTNNHVVEEAEEIEVGFADGRTARARIIGSDPESDLAVLKVENGRLPVITFGHSDQLKVGDVVLAIGNPFGVGQTVTQGIISATGRNQLGINTFENFIQTDAAINPGNSGGALINARGELVGINTAIFSRTGGNQGIGFAIPVSLAKEVMTGILEKGHVTRGWLGIEVQDFSPELAESFGLSSREGVLVAGVLKDGPAARADLRPGDIVLRIGGETVRDVRHALDLISRAAPGSRLPVEGLREGRPFETQPKVGERPPQRLPRP